jgi:protein-S-isoprenylcysteine O-methyltransferase Ste14
MSSPANFFTSCRVRLGYPVALVVFWFARPTPRMILLGSCLGVIGLWIRGYAAGYLHKQERLAAAGPYAYTRNPLYFGSAVLMLGLALAANSWISSFVLIGYFAVFYSMVMRREEEELRQNFGPAFEQYARSVPLFFPRIRAASREEADSASFSWAQYWENHEYQAAIGFLLVLGILVLIWAARFA